MSFDDPLEQLRWLNRQFDELRDLGRSPVDEIAEAVRQQHELYENSISSVREPLDQVTTFSTLAGQTQEYLAEVVAVRDAIAPSVLPSEIEDLRKQWEELDAFYEARDLVSRDVFDSQTIVAAIADSASLELATSAPLAAFRQSLQQQLQEVSPLREALPALKFEQQLGNLSELLELPQTVAQLSTFGEMIQAEKLVLQPSIDLFEQFRTLSASLELPYLDLAAQQWVEALGSMPADILASQPLLGSTLATIATVASIAASENGDPTQNVILVWKGIVDAQIARFGPDGVPHWLQGFLINLLFLLLGLWISNQGAEQIDDRFARIEAGQAQVVQELEAEAERRRESQDAQDSELELLRDALAFSSEAALESHSNPNLLIVSVNLRLRSGPSAEAPILMTIPLGQAIEVVEQSDAWSKVTVMDFTSGEMATGWVASRYLQPWDSLDD